MLDSYNTVTLHQILRCAGAARVFRKFLNQLKLALAVDVLWPCEDQRL